MNHDLENVTAKLVTSGKGLLAAYETVPTLTERFDTLGIQSTEESRRCFRRHAPVSIQGIVFLSGSQEERVATVRLNARWGSTGTYTDEMEGELVGAGSSAHRRTWDDD